MAQNLVNINYDINARDSIGNTPLMTAVMNEDEKMIRNLITAGADVMMLNYENKSALQMVLANHFFLPSTLKMFFYELRKIFTNNEEIAQNLIDAGCRLYQAAFFNDFKITEYMLKQGFPLYSMRPLSKETELHIAVSLGNIDGVQLLLKYASNDTSYVKYGNETRAENLINKNYYINAQDFEGATPLMIAIWNKNEIIIKLLLGAGADITVGNYKNKSALQIFCAVHYFTFAIKKLFFRELRKMFATSEEAAQYLIDSGCHLYHAAYFGDAKIIEYMLRQGLSPNSMHPRDKRTALHIAVFMETVDSVKLLLEYGANLNAQRDECIELLLHYNANPQFIVTHETNNEQIINKTKSLEKLKPAVAHLAVLEGLGTSMTEITCTRMNSFPPLNKYFNECQRLMKKRISGSLTIFQLLTANEKQIARYSCNEKLMLKLSRLIYKQDLISFHSYYYNNLRKSFKRGIRYSRLLDQVAKVICKVFVGRVDKSHFVINKIIDYLNDESLQKLYVLSEAMQKCK